jgi:exosortase D (VPLPA-CTERM-specific)
LPLPGEVYYELSTYLQSVSTHLGVFFLQLLQVPVFVDGNIIDLGVYKLQVAEACSGLRYLFPIMSFSYIFSVLYRGPVWHKIVLLVSAGPITVLMNSIRIAIAGVVVDRFGTEFVEGLTHLLEGWVIFVACILVLFALAQVMLFLRRDRMSLVDALDLRFDGLRHQAARLRLIEPSGALVAAALLVTIGGLAWQAIPPRPLMIVDRQGFSQFPTQLGEWTAGHPQKLSADVETALGADDYYSASLSRAGTTAPVALFMVWYKDQTERGIHSPTVCLPGSGWEIAKLDQVSVSDNAAGSAVFTVNRAVIQNGYDRMLVYYWYEQRGQRMASSYWIRVTVTMSRILTGRGDGALVRLITPIAPGESEAAAEERLQSAVRGVVAPLPRFAPA